MPRLSQQKQILTGILTPNTLSKILGVSHVTIRRLCERATITSTKVGSEYRIEAPAALQGLLTVRMVSIGKVPPQLTTAIENFTILEKARRDIATSTVTIPPVQATDPTMQVDRQDLLTKPATTASIAPSFTN